MNFNVTQNGKYFTFLNNSESLELLLGSGRLKKGGRYSPHYGALISRPLVLKYIFTNEMKKEALQDEARFIHILYLSFKFKLSQCDLKNGEKEKKINFETLSYSVSNDCFEILFKIYSIW